MTDCEFEIGKLHKLFEHHIVASSEEGATIDHSVSFIPVENGVRMPSDVRKHWKGRYVGCTQDSYDIQWFRSDGAGVDYLFVSPEICVVHDAVAHKSIVCINCKRGKDGKLERPDFRDAIIVILHTIMSIHDRYAVHAAAVEIDGYAHLLLGESGSGKSTLSTDLAKLGAKFMGDDIVFIYRKDNVPMVGSLMFVAKLFPEGNTVHKDMVNVLVDYKTEGSIEAPLKAYHYVRRGNRPETYLEKQQPMEGMVMLIESSNQAQMQYDAREWHEVCWLMAEQASYYKLYFGDRKQLSLSLFQEC